jgi:tetratricopeptide (TPR) repeat protein
LRKNGNFDEAIKIIDKYFLANLEIPYTDRYHLELNLGVLYWNSGNILESQRRYLAAYRLEKLIPRSSIVSNFCHNAILIVDLYNKAKEARDSRFFPQSKSLFFEAIAISKKILSPEHEAKCLRQLSLVYWYENDLHMFGLLNNECLNIARQLNLFKDTSICLNNLGLYCYKNEDYISALKYFEESLSISQKNKYFQSESECLTNLGVLHKDIGNYEFALSCFNRALEIDKKYFGNDYISNDINNIGTIYRKLGLLSFDDNYFSISLKYFLNSLELLTPAY